MTESEARATGRPMLKATRAMARVGRARERGETQGFMRVLVDAQTKKIVGAALLGIEADEAIHCIIDVMAAGLPYTAISRTVHIHPTVSELIPTLLRDLQPLQPARSGRLLRRPAAAARSTADPADDGRADGNPLTVLHEHRRAVECDRHEWIDRHLFRLVGLGGVGAGVPGVQRDRFRLIHWPLRFSAAPGRR